MKNHDLSSIRDGVLEIARKMKLADEQRRSPKLDPAVRSTNDPGYLERSAEILQATVRLFASRS